MKPPIFSILLMSFFSATLLGNAQTIICGNTSGTWAPAGNPYIISCDANVPAGQTLTIQPGVVVWIGSNVTLTANGSLIQALGTPSQRITIQQPTGASTYWNTISLINAPGTNRFKYCDFVNSQTAITMGAYGNIQPVSFEIMNCTFSNCFSRAVYGEAIGGFNSGSATLNPIIKNCVFNNLSNGCVLYISGIGQSLGHANPRIIGNIFQNLNGTAFLMTIGGSAGSSQPLFINNSIVNCHVATDATDPWDAQIQNNIFMGATNAAKVSGLLSRSVSYNNFFGNATNFTGYPATFGQVLIANRNGTPSDILYNVFPNPLFIATNDFHLQTTSPCINAGTPDDAFTDMCVPPSAVTTNFPEMGAYGGPDACNWLDVVPLLAAQASMSRSNNVLLLKWSAVPRSTYQVQYLATNFNATAGTNKWLTNSIVTPPDRPISIVVSPYPTTNSNGYYRLRSLGRTAGN